MPKTQFKVIIIGTTNVGKTSILLRLMNDTTPIDNIEHTINLSCHSINYIAKNKISVDLCYWDTAGQERFESIGPMYYQYANAAIAVMDSSDIQTFEKAKNYIETFKNSSGYQSDSLIVLVANKIDLLDDDDIDSTLINVSGWCEDNQYFFFKTSALNGSGINDKKEIQKHLPGISTWNSCICRRLFLRCRCRFKHTYHQCFL